jgi:hypothetical protein
MHRCKEAVDRALLKEIIGKEGTEANLNRSIDFGAKGRKGKQIEVTSRGTLLGLYETSGLASLDAKLSIWAKPYRI